MEKVELDFVLYLDTADTNGGRGVDTKRVHCFRPLVSCRQYAVVAVDNNGLDDTERQYGLFQQVERLVFYLSGVVVRRCKVVHGIFQNEFSSHTALLRNQVIHSQIPARSHSSSCTP